MSPAKRRIEFVLSLGVLVAIGCAESRARVASQPSSTRLAPVAPPKTDPPLARLPTPETTPDAKQETTTAPVAGATSSVRLVSVQQATAADGKSAGRLPEPEPVVAAIEPSDATPLQFDEVIDSVVASYPLLRSIMFGRNVTQGEFLAAQGEYDLKLKGETLNLAMGDYKNYRHAVGLEQPLFGGGSVFGGYRLGRGDYQTYYGQRETDDGGEFKAGVVVPLAQNRAIDDRRANLWRRDWDMQAIEPEIQGQLIEFIRGASFTYWDWVAAGQNVRIAKELLANATQRNEGLRTRVERGDAPAIELTDNERLIVSRRMKLIDAERKFQQSAYKLSLFLRDEAGEPLPIDAARLPENFPPATDPARRDLEADIALALGNRPELRALEIYRQQLNIDLAAAQNQALPQFDAVLGAAQDVGPPADVKKDDKAEFELEAGLFASVPLQRRKAQGKAMAVEGKMVQVRAKTRFTRDKIVAEVQSADAALRAAYRQLGQVRRSLELARQMETAERRKFDLGESNLLLVNLREQATADAAAVEVEAWLNFYDAQADYRAALAGDSTP